MHPPAGSLTAGPVGGDLGGKGSAGGSDLLHQPVPSRDASKPEIIQNEKPGGKTGLDSLRNQAFTLKTPSTVNG
jgi:hypothetical protein